MPSKSEIIGQMSNIFRDVLDNDAITLSENTTANDVEEWDSLSHIQLVVAVEKHFKVRFTTFELTSYKNVGDMADGIMKKLAS
jgi:acyl carrier protein